MHVSSNSSSDYPPIFSDEFRLHTQYNMATLIDLHASARPILYIAPSDSSHNASTELNNDMKEVLWEEMAKGVWDRMIVSYNTSWQSAVSVQCPSWIWCIIKEPRLEKATLSRTTALIYGDHWKTLTQSAFHASRGWIPLAHLFQCHSNLCPDMVMVLWEVVQGTTTYVTFPWKQAIIWRTEV